MQTSNFKLQTSSFLSKLLIALLFLTQFSFAALTTASVKKQISRIYKNAQTYNKQASTNSEKQFAANVIKSLKNDAKKLAPLQKNEKSAQGQAELKKIARRLQKIDKELKKRLAVTKTTPKANAPENETDIEAQIQYHDEKLKKLQQELTSQNNEVKSKSIGPKLTGKDLIRKNLTDKHFLQANKRVDSLIVRNSSDHELHALKAQSHKGLREYHAARQSIKEAIRLQSINSNYWDILGSIQAALRDDRAAFSAWNEALNLNPGNWSAKIHTADLLLQKGYLDSAQNIYKSAEKAQLKNYSAYRGIGIIASRRHNNDRAKTYFNKALEMQPDNKEILMLLAETYLEEQQFHYAEEFYKRLLQLNPKLKAARFALGMTALKSSEYVSAIYHLEQLYAMDENYPDIRFWLPAVYFIHGEYLQQIGNHVESTRLYQKALTINPKSSQWLAYGNYKVGDDYRILNNYREAEKYLTKALELDPRHLESCFALGMMHWDNQDFQKAGEYWSYILDIDPDHEKARSWMSMLKAKVETE